MTLKMQLQYLAFAIMAGTSVAVASLSRLNAEVILDLVHSKLDFDQQSLAAKAYPMKPDLLSLSMEFGNTIDFLGDVGKPNTFSRQHIENVVARTGKAPILRLGGNTQDKSEFCKSCRNGTMVTVFEGEGPLASEATKVTYNPDLFKVMAENSVDAQEYIFGLSFGSGRFHRNRVQNSRLIRPDNVSVAEESLTGALTYFDQSRIYSYELGNEVNLYGAYVPYRPKTWTVLDYAKEILEWYPRLTTLTSKRRFVKHQNLSGVEFQFGSFVGPPYGFPDFNHVQLSAMNVPQATNAVITLATHGYPNNICTPAAAAKTTLATYLNHLQTVAWVMSWGGEIAAAKANGYEYHIGETGSVGCHGKPGVSDTFGAALWVLDYTLTAATLGVDRIFFHNGKGGFVYNMWEPTDSVARNGTVTTTKQTRPSYYSMLFVGDLIKGVKSPRVTRVEQFDTTSLVHFAVFDEGGALRKLAIINTGLGTDTAQPRTEKVINVSSVLGEELRVMRLTAPNVTATTGVTWAQQSVDEAGKLTGAEAIELVSNGFVKLLAGEAVIVESK